MAGEEKHDDTIIPANPKNPPTPPPLTMVQALRGLPQELSSGFKLPTRKLKTADPSETPADAQYDKLHTISLQQKERAKMMRETAKVVQDEYSLIKINTTKSLKSVINSINAGMPYKIIFLIAFFAIFYNVIFNICIFFGIDIILLNMYMGWVSFILILFTFLPTSYSDIFTLNKE